MRSNVVRLGNWYCNICCSKGSSHSSHLTNGMTDKKVLYASDDSLQYEDNDALVIARQEKDFKLVVENDSNCKEKSSSEDSSDSLRDEQMNSEYVDDNQSQSARDEN